MVEAESVNDDAVQVSVNSFVPIVDERFPVKRNGTRLLALDLMRGLIMIVMAWDHTKDIWVAPNWAPKTHGMESWEGEFSSYDNNWWFFIARAVSNLSAPGFYFTMGMSLSLFSVVRQKSGWSSVKIVKHFLLRSLVLLLVGRLVNVTFTFGMMVQLIKGEDVKTWLGPVDHKHPMGFLIQAFVGIFQVMTGLGLTMATSLFFLIPMLWMNSKEEKFLVEDDQSISEELTESLLSEQSVHRKSWLKSVLWDSISRAELVSYFVFVVVYAFSNGAIVSAQGDDFYLMKNSSFPDGNFRAHGASEIVLRFMLYPGELPSPLFQTSYPVFPWIAVTVLGIGFGFSLNKNPNQTIRRLGVLSIVFLLLFFVIRLFGGSYGNLRGLPRGDGVRPGFLRVDKLMAFFIMSKYPPSLAFSLFYVGIDSGIIYGFFRSIKWYSTVREGRGWWSPVEFFWDTCKIFGQVPLFFYVLHFWILGPTSALACAFTDDYKLSLPLCAVLWFFLLALLRPICARYGAFKKTTSKDSWWRLL